MPKTFKEIALSCTIRYYITSLLYYFPYSTEETDNKLKYCLYLGPGKLVSIILYTKSYRTRDNTTASGK